MTNISCTQNEYSHENNYEAVLARDNINNLGNMHLWATTIKIVQFAATIFRCFIFLPLPLFVSAAKKELSCAFPSSPLNAYKCHWHTLHHDERSRCCQRQVMRQCHPSCCWISKLSQSFLHTDSLPQIWELTRKLRKDGKKMLHSEYLKAHCSLIKGTTYVKLNNFHKSYDVIIMHIYKRSVQA